jgi:hypothetical protein
LTVLLTAGGSITLWATADDTVIDSTDNTIITGNT